MVNNKLFKRATEVFESHLTGREIFDDDLDNEKEKAVWEFVKTLPDEKVILRLLGHLRTNGWKIKQSISSVAVDPSGNFGLLFMKGGVYFCNYVNDSKDVMGSIRANSPNELLEVAKLLISDFKDAYYKSTSNAVKQY